MTPAPAIDPSNMRGQRDSLNPRQISPQTLPSINPLSYSSNWSAKIGSQFFNLVSLITTSHTEEPEAPRVCGRFGMTDEWCSLRRSVGKSDVIGRYGDAQFPMQLRLFAEQICRSSLIPGQWGKSMIERFPGWRMVEQMRNFRFSACCDLVAELEVWGLAWLQHDEC
jgi:hypothetical protein